MEENRGGDKVTVIAKVFTKDEELGFVPFEITKKTRIKDLEKVITKDIAGDEFRKIALVEDFMRMVFSTNIVVPVKICSDANVQSVFGFYDHVYMVLLFERQPLTFDLSQGYGPSESADLEVIKERILNSGHYLGTYATPGISIDDLSEFVDRRKHLPVDVESLPEEIEIKARLKRKSEEFAFNKETPILDVAYEIFEGFGFDKEVYFYLFKGDIEKCVLSMEFPPYAMIQGFSYATLGEAVALFKNDFSINYDGEEIIDLEVMR